MKSDLDQVILDLGQAAAVRNGLRGSLLQQAKQIVSLVAAEERTAELEVMRAAQSLPQPWTPIKSAWLPTGGDTGRTRSRQVHVGNVVRVAGLGKRSSATGERTTSAGWKITGMAQRGDEINVVVLKNGVERTVRLDRIR